MQSPFASLAAAPFVALTTFRRTGAPVSTAVWVVQDGDRLGVMTPAGTGKVKRLAHTSRVTLARCSRRGVVESGAGTITAAATVSQDPADIEHLRSLLRAKYGFEYRLFMAIEKLAKRMRETPRVAVWIVPPPA
jgi:PPOX class probable F420-dependent enzyme